MFQSAIFVDAGYFFAQGAQLLSGSRQTRSNCSLDVEAVGRLLISVNGVVAPDARLLRSYWYDGLIRGGTMTAEQVALSRAADIKLRLGLVNSRGEQKGVDSLIVIDLVELARNKAITDAILVSGDEDIRAGVQLAQTYGVRVHLVGIKPALGNQSPDLLAEADTHTEWNEANLASALTVTSRPRRVESVAVGDAVGSKANDFEAFATDWAARVVAEAGENLRQQVRDYIDANRGALPSDIDRPALAGLRDLLMRELTPDERKQFRSLVRQAFRR